MVRSIFISVVVWAVLYWAALHAVRWALIADMPSWYSTPVWVAAFAIPAAILVRGYSFVDANSGQRAFDTLYPGLGSRSQATLAIELGASVDEENELVFTSDQEVSVDGLCAIGNVVSALNQTSVEVGHAAVAATSNHKVLPLNRR